MISLARDSFIFLFSFIGLISDYCKWVNFSLLIDSLSVGLCYRILFVLTVSALKRAFYLFLELEADGGGGGSPGWWWSLVCAWALFKMFFVCASGFCCVSGVLLFLFGHHFPPLTPPPAGTSQLVPTSFPSWAPFSFHLFVPNLVFIIIIKCCMLSLNSVSRPPWLNEHECPFVRGRWPLVRVVGPNPRWS